jgi:hypothetical protein
MRAGVRSGIVDEDFVFAFPNDVEAPPIIGRFTHVWTRCVFGDGQLTIYNRFKAKRLNGCAENIAHYYVFGGDGDSWWRGSDCSVNHVNLPAERWRLVRSFGRITRIQIIDHPPECSPPQAPRDHSDHGGR